MVPKIERQDLAIIFLRNLRVPSASNSTSIVYPSKSSSVYVPSSPPVLSGFVASPTISHLESGMASNVYVSSLGVSNTRWPVRLAGATVGIGVGRCLGGRKDSGRTRHGRRGLRLLRGSKQDDGYGSTHQNNDGHAFRYTERGVWFFGRHRRTGRGYVPEGGPWKGWMQALGRRALDSRRMPKNARRPPASVRISCKTLHQHSFLVFKPPQAEEAELHLEEWGDKPLSHGEGVKTA